CDYSDWSPSLTIIPSVYLLVFFVGCFGNSLVLWAFLDRPEGRRMRRRDLRGTRKSCLSGVFRKGQRNVSGTDRSNHQSFPTQNTENSACCRPSSQFSTSSYPPCIPSSSRSLTDSLIASLALADLCFLVTLPLWAVYTAMGYHWPFGQPLWMLALPGLLLRSVRVVEVESEDDWQLEPTHPDPGSVFLSCQMDYSMLIGADLEEAEREKAEMWWAAALSLKSTLIGFLLPLVILLVCYCSLAQLLSRHFGKGPRPDRKRQRRLLKVIVTLVMAFFLCWLPLHVNKTLSMLLEFGFVPYSCSLDQLLLGAHPYVTCLAYLNSCLNPLLYAACDPSFRKRCR
ncbi:unnamed protein product, partial [Tetraodon nigroviridis]